MRNPPAPAGRRRALRVCASLAVAVLLVSEPADAQVTFDGCRNSQGVAVASVRNDGIQDVAVAMRAPGGQPIIMYNLQVLSWLQQQTRLFFYAHECAHHVLQHDITGPSLAGERAADCWAIRTLINQFNANQSDVQVIQADIRRAGKGDWTHLPGPERSIELVERCLGGSSSAGSGGVENDDRNDDGEEAGSSATSIVELAALTLKGRAGRAELRAGSISGFECKFDPTDDALQCSRRVPKDDAEDAWGELLGDVRSGLDGWEEEERSSSTSAERFLFSQSEDGVRALVFVSLSRRLSSLSTQRLNVRFTYIE